MGAAQRELDHLRPVCFYSAYEAATSFVIGQRIARRQSAVIKRDLAEELGDRPTVAGTPFPAFPRPERLLKLREARGLNQTKVERLHGLARAAIDGRLDTEVLRMLSPETALARLQELPGVGPFTAQGVYYRGCGIADGIPTPTSSDARSSATCTGSPMPPRPTSPASARHGGRTGCGQWSCCGWHGAAARDGPISYRRDAS